MKEIPARTQFTVGEEASLSRTITEADIDEFARVTGDDNPVHLDEEYARGTFFGGRIAHGMISASLVAAVLGTRLPGPGSIYLGQQLRFTAPVRPGDTVTAHVRVTAWDEVKGRLTLLTEVTNQAGVKVITGEAQLMMASFLRKP